MAVSWFFLLSGFIIAYNYPLLPTVTSRGCRMTISAPGSWVQGTSSLMLGH